MPKFTTITDASMPNMYALEIEFPKGELLTHSVEQEIDQTIKTPHRTYTDSHQDLYSNQTIIKVSVLVFKECEESDRNAITALKDRLDNLGEMTLPFFRQAQPCTQKQENVSSETESEDEGNGKALGAEGTILDMLQQLNIGSNVNCHF